MRPQKDKIYILNPCYVLRNDIHRIALFSIVDTGMNDSKDWLTFIHPIQAVMLSFFTYNRSWAENIQLLSVYFHKDTAYMENIIVPYLENKKPIFTKWNDQEILFPKNILIETGKVKKGFLFLQLPVDLFICQKLDLKTRRFYSGPLLLTLMLTNKCVTHCKYCYADTTTSVRNQLSTPRIIALIREAARMQVQQVNLMGGEVFLHKDWVLILKELVQLKIYPEYISTKIPFTKELLSQLRSTGYHHVIQVSLDACSIPVLQTSLGVSEEYLSKMQEGLQLLDQSGLEYQVSTVLSNYNCDRHILADLFRFLSTLKHLRDWRISLVSNSSTIPYDTICSFKPSREIAVEIFSYLEEFIIPASPFPILINKTLLEKQYYTTEGGSGCFKGATCSALNTHLFILPDGQVTICEQLYWNPHFIIGDVNLYGLRDVWNSSRALFLADLSIESIQKASKCGTCMLFDSCFKERNRCWSDIVKAYGENCWDFPDPRCNNAPSMIYNIDF